MTTASRRRWLKRFAIGVPIAVFLVGGALYVSLLTMLSISNSQCEELKQTVFEEQLANGDWLKIRSEPDCSPTGGPRMHLYMKADPETEYRFLAWWKGGSANGVEPYLDAPTPIIQTPASDHLLLRSAQTGWHNVTVKDITNTALSPEFPLIAHNAYLSYDGGFDSLTNELSVVGNWGRIQRRMKLRVAAHARFQFVDFDVPPMPLSRDLDIPSSHPFSGRIAKDESGQFRLFIRRGSRTPSTDSQVIGSRPVRCSVEIEDICANTQLLRHGARK